MSEREVLFHAEAKDFRVDTYRGTGPGGQHRNKTDSCVRITHEATGLTAQCCESRSQMQNKRAAFRKLAPLVIEHYLPARQKARAASGTEVIRTYHAVDNRVQDVASGLVQPYADVLNDGCAMIRARHDAMSGGIQGMTTLDNFAYGRNALFNLTTGSGNTAIFHNAGAHLTTECNQCWVGPVRVPNVFAPLVRRLALRWMAR